MIKRTLASAVAAGLLIAGPAMADKLDEIKERGVLKCPSGQGRVCNP